MIQIFYLTFSLPGEHDMYCCRGYCMDLLNSLATELNFTYSLYQVEDGLYGSFDYVMSTSCIYILFNTITQTTHFFINCVFITTHFRKIVFKIKMTNIVLSQMVSSGICTKNIFFLYYKT